MDGSRKKTYSPVRPVNRKTDKRQSFAIGTNASTPKALTEPLTIDPVALAPPPPAPFPADNLLKNSIRAQPVVFSASVPGKAEYGDTVQLLANGKEVGAPIFVDDFLDDYGMMRISLMPPIPGGHPEGRHSINYVMQYLSGGEEFERGPDGQFFITDYTAPGGALLGTLRFSDEVVANGVTPAALVDDGEGGSYLPARVPNYQGLAPGDVVTGIVGTSTEDLDAVVIDSEELELRFKRAFIESQGDGALDFSYSVIDRAGNPSKISDPVNLQVLLAGVITDLLPPLVPAYDDDEDPKLIDDADARADGGLKVLIPRHARLLIGDKVSVLWGAAEIGSSTIVDPLLDPVLTIGIPYAAISDTWNAASSGADVVSPVYVSYRVTRMALPVGTPPVPATVGVNLHQSGGGDPDPETPVNENLKAPKLTSASGAENTIPPADSKLPATIAIPWLQSEPANTPALVEGDVVVVTYGGVALEGRTIDADDVAAAADVSVTLPEATIIAVGSGAIPMFYTVTRTLAAGGSNMSISPSQDVAVSGDDELPGGGELAAGTVPEAVGTDTKDPTRLLIGKTQGKDGTDFIIPPYKNQAPGDTITFTAAFFRSFYTRGHPTDRKSTDDRNFIIEDLHPSGTASPTVIHLTEVQLMRYDFDTEALHAHLSYTIVGANAPGRPVNSPDVLVDVDPRGDST